MDETQSAPWKILIVDDEPEVHTVTKIVLSHYSYAERPLLFISAHSAAEAKSILAATPDIAVILLDVIMEEEDSGLKLVSHIRQELKNRLVRIILRTGQPGQVPEHKVILDYDINDYKAKNELTYQKLYTSVTAALRAYDAMYSLDSQSRELYTEKELMSATLHSIEDAVIAVDTDGRITMMNEIAEALTGCRFADTKGKALCDYIELHPRTGGPVIPCPVAETLKSEKAVSCDDPVLLTNRKNSDEYLINYKCSPITLPSGSVAGAVTVIRDVTTRIRMEEELQKVQKLESIGILAGGIAHDFNNILTGIMGNISLTKLDVPKERKSYTYLGEAEKAVMRAQVLTRQLLSFSKGSAPVKEAVKSREIIDDAIAVFLTSHFAKIEKQLSDDLPWINADKGQIAQAIGNLLMNAFQATSDKGSITVLARQLAVTAENDYGLREGDYLKITIADTGEGIDDGSMQKLFDPFYTTRPGGNGLGLTTAFTIVKRHGGMISAASKKGEGSQFDIFIPAVDAPLKTGSEPGKAAASENKISVLLMDDDEFIIKSVSGILAYMGFDTDVARDGTEALDKYRKRLEEGKPFGVVIMDLTIPGGVGGKAAIGMLKELDPNVHAIVSSGYSDDPVMAEYAAYGFKGVILKPYKPQDLADTIRKVAAL